MRSDDEIVDVLIVGGGLGGLALAVGLSEQKRFSWAICEAAPELRTATGTLMGIGPNGLVGLEAISPRIPPLLIEAGQLTTHSERNVRPPGSQWHDPVRTALPAPLYTIRWAAMQNVLARLVDSSRVRCGHKCRDYIEEDCGTVRVRFVGQPDIRARFVVGADGVGSAVRRCMFPADPGPRYLGYMNWNALRHVPGSSSAPGSDTIRILTDGTGSFSTLVYIINAGDDIAFWQVRIGSTQADFTNGVGAGAGVPGSKERVLAWLRDLGWEDAIAIVQETDESAIYERGMLDRLPLDSWSTASSRVVLLGDAAHAMYAGPGQGARTAFEDAHQLLTALNAAWPDVAEVARRYEDARVLRTNVIQMYAASMCTHMPGDLAQHINGFWARLDADAGRDEQTAQRERAIEFQGWLNTYPENVHGIPGSTYTSPDVLRAFKQHCVDAMANSIKIKAHIPAPGSN